MGVINFKTGGIRLFEEKITAFTYDDYYISCDKKDDETGIDMDPLIFYCPERYSD